MIAEQPLEKQQRFIALDIVRGITVALMIICNNNGGPEWYFLQHSLWQGFSLSDAVAPAYIFCMGFAMVFSLKHVTKFDWLFVRKILIRSLILFAIGLVLIDLDHFFQYLNDGLGFIKALNQTMYTTRFYGVFQRLGFAYLFAAIIIILSKKNVKWILGIASVILIGYLFLLGFGHGYEFSKDNVIYIVDNAIFSPNHLYEQTIDGVSLSFDPEGLLSSIPCIAQALLGYAIGKIYIEYKDKKLANLGLFISAASLIILGLFISTFAPIIKKTSSTSFILISSGIPLAAIALVCFFTNKKDHNKSLYFWRVLGANPLGVYLVSVLIGYCFNHIMIGESSIHGLIFGGFKTMCCGNLEAASFVYALMFLIITWLIGLLLYKKKIFIRL